VIHFDIGSDLFPLLAAMLACVACAVLGNFLVLRRLSLMGDAISHSVLPGLVIAFMLSASRNPLVMFAGAAAAAVATVVLVEVVKRLGRVEPGAAMGVVFSLLFALGVLLIEQAAVRHVDLDADCVLHGQLEALAWFGAPDTLAGLLQWSTLEAVPRQVWTLLAVCTLSLLFVGVLFKELRIAAFDPQLATAQGYHAGIMHALLMVLVAVATVASFEAVGSILVIAMLICPAVTARVLTDRLLPQVLVSILVAIATALLGYAGAIVIPDLFGKDAVNAAGSIATVSGILLVLAAVFSPRHGVVWYAIRRLAMAKSIATDDLLAAIYRLDEAGQPQASVEQLRPVMQGHALPRAISSARSRGLVTQTPSGLQLTEQGLARSRDLVRRHRLWEAYLVDKAGVAPDHVHPIAELLEHLPLGPKDGPPTDPHGRAIPRPDAQD